MQKNQNLAYLIAGLIFSFGSLFVILFWFKMLTNTNSNFGLYAIGLILLIPVWIYLIINKQERMRVNTFNHAYVKETMID
ncbi:MAG: hypothetical protein GXO84_11470 [Chlorobi bacterium]|nr:hypothetical protein [Chlorobiota bacterium]